MTIPRWLAYFTLIAVGLLVVAPLAAFLAYALFTIEDGQIIRRVSLDNFHQVLTNTSYTTILGRSALMSAQVALLAIIAGLVLAMTIWRAPAQIRAVLLTLIVAPMLVSYVIKLYAIRSMLGVNGAINQSLIGLGLLDSPAQWLLFNLSAVRLTLVLLIIPFAVLPILASLDQISESILQASHDLGATGWRTFRSIVLPIAAPGIVTAATFSFVLAMGDFLVPELMGGTNGFTYGRLIFSQFGLAFNWPLGAAMGFVLFVPIFFLLVVTARITTPKWQGGVS